MKSCAASGTPVVCFTAAMPGLYLFASVGASVPNMTTSNGQGNLPGGAVFLDTDDTVSYTCANSFQLAGCRLGDELTDE